MKKFEAIVLLSPDLNNQNIDKIVQIIRDNGKNNDQNNLFSNNLEDNNIINLNINKKSKITMNSILIYLKFMFIILTYFMINFLIYFENTNIFVMFN